MLFAGVGVQREPRRREQGDLSPFALAVNRDHDVGRQDIETLARTETGKVFAMKEFTRKFNNGRGPDQPVEREYPGRYGCSGDMSLAEVKSGGDLNSPVAGSMEKREPALVTGPGTFEGTCIRGGLVGGIVLR
jgi:hypothetical protein